MFSWSEIPINNINNLDYQTKKIVIQVLKSFAVYDQIYLAEWNHNEPAYKKARGTKKDYIKADDYNEITKDIIKEFYVSK